MRCPAEKAAGAEDVVEAGVAALHPPAPALPQPLPQEDAADAAAVEGRHPSCRTNTRTRLAASPQSQRGRNCTASSKTAEHCWQSAVRPASTTTSGFR